MQEASTNRSNRCGSAAGIPQFLHWTFWLSPAYGIPSGLAARRLLFGMTADPVLVTVILACVVLHESGHAIVTRRCGVRTRGVLLMSISHVARLEGMPGRAHEVGIITDRQITLVNSKRGINFCELNVCLPEFFAGPVRATNAGNLFAPRIFRTSSCPRRFSSASGEVGGGGQSSGTIVNVTNRV